MHCDNAQVQQGFIAAWGLGVEVRMPSIPSSYSRPSKYLIDLDVIPFDGAKFILNVPIEVSLYQDEGLWYCEHPTFSILSSGNTPVEAVHSFCEDFSVLWDEIAQCPDDSLTREAQDVKRILLAAVKSFQK
jgi:hypothetical protein